MDQHELKTLAHVFQELNAIRARDGAPPGVSEEWWDLLTERVRSLFSVYEPEGAGPHCHPLLYKSYEELRQAELAKQEEPT